MATEVAPNVPQITQGLTWILPLVGAVAGALAGWGTAALKIGRYAEKVDQLEKCNLQQRLSTLEGSVNTSRDYTKTLTRSKSPIGLTEKGDDLLKRSSADAFVLQHKNELVKKIKDQKPPTAYDVQEMARQIVESLKDDVRFKPFKDFVYTEGIDLEPIFIVMSIYLRDIALAELGFKPEDIDKSDPTHAKKERSVS